MLRLRLSALHPIAADRKAWQKEPCPLLLDKPVYRFAPSPNGLLHLGHALSAILNHDMARDGGRFLLRIEDIDLARCTPEFEAAIYRDLAWLGLDWERPVRRQSEHFGAYHAAGRLTEMGLVFRLS